MVDGVMLSILAVAGPLVGAEDVLIAGFLKRASTIPTGHY
jgi:hypothetical protein